MALKPTDMMPSLLTSQFKIFCHTIKNGIKVVIWGTYRNVHVCFKHYRKIKKIKSTAVKAQYKQYLKGSLTVAKESTYLLKNWQIFPHTVR